MVSKEQKNIYNYIQNEKGNLLINAVAGSGKTYTIVQSMKLLPPDKRVLCIAFNKSIVNELKKKVPPHVRVATVHSIGYGLLRNKYQNIEINNKKYRLILNKLVSIAENRIEETNPRLLQLSKHFKFDLRQPKHPDYNIVRKNYYKNILDLCDLGRLYLVNSIEVLEKIAIKYRILTYSDEVVRALNLIGIGGKEKRIIDFTDMIWLPIVEKLFIYKYDYVYTDEVQDINNAQRYVMLSSVKKNGRIIMVGDERQAIYGFGGADNKSFEKLEKIKNTTQLPLTVCFRCAKNIVKEAAKIVPDIRPYEKNENGIVRKNGKISEIRRGDMVLCRSNAPLVQLYYSLKTRNISAKLYAGEDAITEYMQLINGDDIATIKNNLQKIYTHYLNKIMQAKQLSKEKAMKSVDNFTLLDKINVIKTLANNSKNKNDLINNLKNIFTLTIDKNTVILSSVHKSKGLENDRVFIIQPSLLPMRFVTTQWEKQQELNLKYVAITRAKKELIFIPERSFNFYKNMESKHSQQHLINPNKL